MGPGGGHGSVCGPELLRDGRITACAEGACQADVPSCRSASTAGGWGWGWGLSAGGLPPAPFVHLCDTPPPTGSTDLHVAASHRQPSNDQEVTFRPPALLRPKDFGRDHRTAQRNWGCRDNGFLPLSPPETVYVAGESLPLLAPLKL